MHLKPKIIEAMSEKVSAIKTEREAIIELLKKLEMKAVGMRQLVHEGIDLTVVGGNVPEMEELEATELEGGVIAVAERLQTLRLLIKEYGEF